jgi:Protein of unknown function (DUF1552)
MKNKPLSRRTFLRGTGVAMALPVLEAMLPIGRSAFAAAATPTRMLSYFVPNGMHMAAWTPTQTGADYTLSKTLAPLANVKSDIMILTGLANRPGQPDQIGDHAGGTGAFITATHVKKTEGADIRNGISIDQVAAKKLGSETRFASLELGMDGGGSAGGCDSGYSCAYTRNISWSGPQTPMPKITSPQQVFDRLFAGVDVTETAEEAAKRKLFNSSILDYVAADARKLQQKLGTNDRAKLDEYLTNIETLEKKLNAATSGGTCSIQTRPLTDNNYTVTEKARLMSDLMVIAFQCDLTRFQTFMLANAGSDRSYGFLGINEGHHTISHHQNLQANYDKLEIINKWEIEQFAYLLDKLKATTDINGGNILDSCAVFFSSDISNGDWHNHYDMPIILAGKANGYFDTGKHIRFTSEKPVANLFRSILEAVGAPVETFGDNSDGLLNEVKKA